MSWSTRPQMPQLCRRQSRECNARYWPITVMLVRHHFLKGWRGTSHSHPHEQLVYVVTGRIQFDVDGKTIELRTGASVIVEGNVEHRATALEDSEVLDVFVPCREDYAL